ncbi:tRNA (adenosine(37)-N6)-threonylcarbamoyltransferase complex ATPase subunit type 1 TsaE [Kangiella sp.]|uniref:tRNA (adenosine(37)-N6)-threonylcarbamoyltransferase complex ATPase subunit type 1 TsaE n=1 Tax=Kangiella sp. TaxID=1920245 RepID=UPI0019B46C34|nr:tRNA (adenosine(37)-N6)-threonylcarbamoyltransferase complex ATPase subunit type 1 TsaE [Kangiella sp.]MBD3652869.1 tRNA (adenosine(37)-N6)-threonylcarbamoyltransferase complex ATPase subunit type 1 TsaE [Kangiella sp.]
MQKITVELADESQTVRMGQKLAACIKAPMTIYFKGELGAGKTTLVRGILRGFGYQGATKSPTYTLVEPYELVGLTIYHFDLYRLADPEELEFIGIREYQQPDSIMLIEWPDKGEGMIPRSDLMIELDYKDDGRKVTLSSAHPELMQKLEKSCDFMPKSS